MTISQRLDLRQSQSLVMTPQLQQAIKLLQMSNQELGAFVEQEIEQNPLLERAEFTGDLKNDIPTASVSTESEDGSYSNSQVSSQDNNEPAPLETLSAEAALEDVWVNDGYSDDEGYGNHSGGFDLNDEFSSAQNVASNQSLREHLMEQIQIDFIDTAERLIASALVELLDEAGYLPNDLEIVRAQLGADSGLFERTIIKLQHLDPPGIFARSLQECLAIQLYEKDRLDEVMQKLLQHLDLVAKREKSALMKICGVDAEDLLQMLDEIRDLNPKPAMAFAMDVAPPITPDVMLRPQHGGGWHVELNGDNLPRVLTNERYYTKVQNSIRAKPDKEYLSERWQQANWLVKALHQRATTILKVAAEIVKQQDNFFVHGIQHLRPLVLRDIAAAVEMHESTVSRVTQNKYIATPRGMFELKYFFSAAISTSGGDENVSATAVRDRISSLIEAENPNSVLSDDDLSAALHSEGINLARRTVAKYREMMKIPSSAQRRRDKKG